MMFGEHIIPTAALGYWPTHRVKYEERQRMLTTEEGREKLASTIATRPLVRLYESIQANGITNPLILRPIVKVGNQRLMCARALGIDAVNVVFADSLQHANDLRAAYEPMYYDVHTDEWEVDK